MISFLLRIKVNLRQEMHFLIAPQAIFSRDRTHLQDLEHPMRPRWGVCLEQFLDVIGGANFRKANSEGNDSWLKLTREICVRIGHPSCKHKRKERVLIIRRRSLFFILFLKHSLKVPLSRYSLILFGNESKEERKLNTRYLPNTYILYLFHPLFFTII